MNPNFEIVTDDNLIENLLFDNSNIGIKNSKRRKSKKWRLKSIEKVIEDFLLNNLESCYVVCTLLPLIALFIDTIYPIATNYSAVIEIRCESHLIENFWPALSQTIGYSYLTQYIWLIFIISHTPLRLLGAHYLRASYDTLTDKSILRFVIKLAYLVNILEIISLCCLAISMLYFFDYHKYVVMMFLLSFLAFLQVNLFIEYKLKSNDPVFYVKLIIGFVYVVCLLTILVTFLYMCEPNVFSIFGIAEIVLVVSNVLFHAMSYFSIKELLRMENASKIVDFC